MDWFDELEVAQGLLRAREHERARALLHRLVATAETERIEVDARVRATVALASATAKGELTGPSAREAVQVLLAGLASLAGESRERPAVTALQFRIAVRYGGMMDWARTLDFGLLSLSGLDVESGAWRHRASLVSAAYGGLGRHDDALGLAVRVVKHAQSGGRLPDILDFAPLCAALNALGRLDEASPQLTAAISRARELGQESEARALEEFATSWGVPGVAVTPD